MHNYYSKKLVIKSRDRANPVFAIENNAPKTSTIITHLRFTYILMFNI